MITHGFPIRSASLRALLLLGRGWQPLGDSRRLCLREHQRCFSFKAPLLFPLIGSAPSYISTPTQLPTTPNENPQKHAQPKTPHTPATNTKQPSPRHPTTVHTTLPARSARKNTTENNPSPSCTGGQNTTSPNLPRYDRAKQTTQTPPRPPPQDKPMALTVAQSRDTKRSPRPHKRNTTTNISRKN